LATLVVIGVYTYYAGGQWVEIQKSTRANIKAADTAVCALRENESQFQITSQSNREQFAQTLDQMTGQTRAALSASNIAKDALHISERAYIFTGMPRIDEVSDVLDVPLINSGHIPSGEATLISHELMADIPAPTNQGTVLGKILDARAQTGKLKTIAVGGGTSFHIGIPMVKRDKISTGNQKIVATLTISYNDGFTETPRREWQFCTQSYYDTTTKLSAWDACDADHWIPIIKEYEKKRNNQSSAALSRLNQACARRHTCVKYISALIWTALKFRSPLPRISCGTWWR
jgi:hypothetical protein